MMVAGVESRRTEPICKNGLTCAESTEDPIANFDIGAFRNSQGSRSYVRTSSASFSDLYHLIQLKTVDHRHNEANDYPEPRKRNSEDFIWRHAMSL